MIWPGTTRRSAGSEQGSPEWRRPLNGTGTTQEGQTLVGSRGLTALSVTSRHAEQSGKVVTNGLRRAPSPLLRSRLVPCSVIPRTFFSPTPSVPSDVTLSGRRHARCIAGVVVAVVSTHSCTGWDKYVEGLG